MRHTSFTAHVSGTTEGLAPSTSVGPSPNSGTSGTSRKRLNDSPLEERGNNKKTRPSSTRQITITVGVLGGDEFDVSVESNATIQDLKKTIESHCGIPGERMHLCTPGKPLPLRNHESIDVLGPKPTVTVLVIVLAKSLENKFKKLLSAVDTDDETGLKTLTWDAFTKELDESEPIPQYARLIAQLVDVECLKFVSYWGKGPLPDLFGLVNLVELYCNGNKLTEMPDMSALGNLVFFDCSSNQLTELPDMSALVNLATFKCANNQLKELPDLSALISLVVFICCGNPLRTLMGLGLSALVQLEHFDCTGNSLTMLPDLSGLVNLKLFICTDNQLTELPALSALANLMELHCRKNQLTTMPDLSRFTKLEWLNCSQNQLTAMPDLSALVNLDGLVCSYNSLMKLDVSTLEKLSFLDIRSNPLTQLPIGLSALKSLATLKCDEEHCSDNQLSALVSLKYLIKSNTTN